ncbi:MAG: hypothetical protein DHS20C16_28360 [Phycisphaerae bacterium]|nr:MAG: hypothetical protein DHS20C16_28360 [Phycisphaerae bacterium]
MKPAKTAFVEELGPSTVRPAGSCDLADEKFKAQTFSPQRDDQPTLAAEGGGPSIEATEVAADAMGHGAAGRTSKSTLVKKLGIAGFLFFTLKGMLWLVAGYAAVKANGCTAWGS